MKYYVTLAIDGRCTVAVDAENIEQAKEEARFAFWEMDLGQMECVGSSFVNIEDEHGNLTDL